MFQIRQLLDELQPPESGKKSSVVVDDANTKVVLFAFAAGDGLAEHVAPLPVIIQPKFAGEKVPTIEEVLNLGAVPDNWKNALRLWILRQHDNQECCDRPQKQRQHPPQKSATPFRLCQSSIYQRERPPANEELSLILHLFGFLGKLLLMLFVVKLEILAMILNGSLIVPAILLRCSFSQ